jgi:hypothetical protein
MDRFKELLFEYREGCLGSDGRAELAVYVDGDPDCLDAFVDAVSELRILRLELQRP